MDKPVTPLTTLKEERTAFSAKAWPLSHGSRSAPTFPKWTRRASFRQDLIEAFLRSGFDGDGDSRGIRGRRFEFLSCRFLAVEELSRIDASAGVIVDVQNTLVNGALLRWGTDEQKECYLPRLAGEWVGAYALSEAGVGKRRLCSQDSGQLRKRVSFTSTGRNSGLRTGKRPRSSLSLQPSIPASDTKESLPFLVERSLEGLEVGKKEDKLGIRASSTCEVLLENCRVPEANVLGEVGKGYKVAIETLNQGRIGIGAQMIGLAVWSARAGPDVLPRTPFLWKAHCRLSGSSVPPGQNGDRA